MQARYVIGIDLGTTNSVLAYVPVESESPQDIQLLPIPQVVAAGTVESRVSLPSFLYLATDEEVAAGKYDLPWATGIRRSVGELARRQSAETPMRTVAAAKSWLAYSRVDRHQAILPWNAPDNVPKVSPVEASRLYLEHLVAAWQHAFPDSPLAEQQVVLTVPASFDASARELTREAALQAGLPAGFTLLEEPQAAVYAWLAASGENWRQSLSMGDTLLVCDVGGGTTDFTLVGVAAQEGELLLDRLAVGNHVLVGGDNMDLALAHQMTAAFTEKGVKLDPWQSVSLWHACRAAKEQLLTEHGPAQHPVTVLGGGSRLIGGTVTIDMQREAASATILDGFFPRCGAGDRPARQRASGFREIGLPYEADAGITRHLAAFLSAHGEPGRPIQPTHILFNGGVFKAAPLRERLLEVISSWYAEALPPDSLTAATAEELDHAVARGAAYYGAAKLGRGIRIRGGTARSYYVGIETAGLAIPGAPRPLNALCVVPFGMEEGTEVEVPARDIGLIVGEAAQFRFFSSAVRKEDQPGDTLTHWTEDELNETDSMETTLKRAVAEEDGYVPVRFETRLTELGVLELWCVSTISDERWKLEFSVREDSEVV